MARFGVRSGSLRRSLEERIPLSGNPNDSAASSTNISNSAQLLCWSMKLVIEASGIGHPSAPGASSTAAPDTECAAWRLITRLLMEVLQAQPRQKGAAF
jgi:hypothetical protein